MLGVCKTVPGVVSELWGLNEYLQEFWVTQALPPAAVFPFELALEEVFMNVVMHGTTEHLIPEVAVGLDCQGGEVTLRMEDTGPAFNPDDAPPPDLDTPLEDRRIGGLGIHLLREMMDDFTYVHEDGRNKLRLSKRITLTDD